MTVNGQISPKPGRELLWFAVGFLFGAGTGILIGVVMAASRPSKNTSTSG